MISTALGPVTKCTLRSRLRGGVIRAILLLFNSLFNGVFALLPMLVFGFR